eukprot:COSAG01_NODE_50458_length_363_cov_0.909091_1_plen_78_part_10
MSSCQAPLLQYNVQKVVDVHQPIPCHAPIIALQVGGVRDARCTKSPINQSLCHAPFMTTTGGETPPPPPCAHSPAACA